jgi:hypothetical protein
MNALLLQILASRMGSTGNPAMAEILMRMTSDETAAAPTTQELLAQMANSGDPAASLIAKQMAAQQPRQAEDHLSVVREVGAEVVADSSRGTNQTASDTASTEAEPETILAELKEIRSRCDDLALALGACPLCWGKDPECRACRGRGHPGFSVPDRKLFVEFVLPAVRTLKAQKAKNNSSSGNIPPKAAEHSAGQNQGAN